MINITESIYITSIAKRLAYYQNVMHFSAYRGQPNAMFYGIFYALFSEQHHDWNAEKKERKAAEFLGSILHHANSF